MLRRILIVAVIVLGFCSVGMGQATLERKFVEDSSYHAQAAQKLQQKLTVAGMEIDTNSESKSVSKITLGKRDVEGKLRAEQRVESLQVMIGVMGQTYNFDSANPDDKGTSLLETVRDVHKALVKQTTTIVYDKNNRAVAVENDQEIINGLPMEVQLLVKSQLDPTHLKDQANQDLDQIKSDPINKGDTWQRTSSVNFGAGQVMDFKTEYTYEGTIEKDGKSLDKITSKVLSIGFALENSPLPLALKSSDLKAAESSGTYLFDRQAGQAVESNSSVQITGELTFTVNNMDLPAKLDLKIESTSAITP
jgi:hypothetical protein